ncbi:MAG: MFS transporter [Chloroflexota bacterium]
MLGYGMMLPIVPFYIERKGGAESNWDCSPPPPRQSVISFAPVWGAVSDRVGRKPILTTGLLGYGIAMFLFGLATKLWMLFVAPALIGILLSAVLPSFMAYIGESTTEKDRGGGMGKMGAAGFIFDINVNYPFLSGAAIQFMGFVISLVWVSQEGRETTHAGLQPPLAL